MRDYAPYKPFVANSDIFYVLAGEQKDKQVILLHEIEFKRKYWSIAHDFISGWRILASE